jgi:two-component system, cell cycle sensor histidine kinase and response regulator CckA
MGNGSRDGDTGSRLSVNAVPLVVAAMSSRRLIKLIRAPWRERSADAARATPEETRSLVRRAFWIAGLALVGVAVTFGVLDTSRAQTERWVLQSREVSRLARQALTLAIDQETGVRGYLPTGDRRSLDAEVAARAQLPRKLDSLVAMTADNRVQHRRALTAREAVERWQREFAAPALAQPDERPSRAALETGGMAHKALFDNVRSSFAVFLEAEDIVYKTRVRREGTQRLFAIRVVALEILALIGVLLVLRTQLVDQTSAVLEQQEQLEEQAVELEERVREAQAMAGQLEASNDELSRSMTETEGARATLAAERRFLRQIIDTMPHFVFAKDRQGRFTLVNQAVADAYGTTIEQLIGKTDADFNPNAAEVEDFRRADLAVMDSLTPQRIAEEPVTDASGAVRWVQTIKQPLVDAGGTADQVLGVSTDITERKRLEVELLHSQKMDAVGQLAGGVAHDFNNMLTVITGYSAILLDVLDRADPNRADIEEIKGAADRAAGLTRQLLAFSRKQVLQPRVLDLNVEVIAGLEKMLRRLIGEDVELVTTLDETLGLVNADSGQVEQVIMNLAVNARDAMPDGGRLVIETANVDLGAEHTGRHIGVKPGRYVMLAVSDTGRGMSRETMARMFEPFFTTKEKGKGTGLGLATVYGVVKQSGGDISVHSEPGQGTTVKVYLPRVQYETDVVLPASAPSRRAAGIETILLVEDDERLCVLSRRVLEARGYIVLEARNGQEALVLCDQHEGRIDLVATDVVMPGINGGMLVERLAVKRPALRVLFMSGYTDDDLLRRGIVDPRMAFLPKPFTPEALASKVREVLDGAGSVVAPSLPFPNASVPVSNK